MVVTSCGCYFKNNKNNTLTQMTTNTSTTTAAFAAISVAKSASLSIPQAKSAKGQSSDEGFIVGRVFVTPEDPLKESLKLTLMNCTTTLPKYTIEQMEEFLKMVETSPSKHGKLEMYVRILLPSDEVAVIVANNKKSQEQEEMQKKEAAVKKAAEEMEMWKKGAAEREKMWMKEEAKQESKKRKHPKAKKETKKAPTKHNN
jgi:hypothetical protein